MNSVKTLAGWQAVALILVLCLSEVLLTINDTDLSVVFMLVTMFTIVAISALIATITKSQLALYIMTAFTTAFAVLFFIFATFPADIIVCIVLAISFARAIDESRLMPHYVTLLATIETGGILLRFRLNEQAGFIIGILCFVSLILASHLLNDQKALKPTPPA